jgi:RHS repeat-associated protein
LYDSWGNVLASTGSTTNPFRFHGAAGVYLYIDTAGYQMRARYYDGRFARFLSRDPVWMPSEPNSYRAFRNDPLSLNDPSGLAPQPKVEFCSKNRRTCNQQVLNNSISIACDCIETALDLMKNHFDQLQGFYGTNPTLGMKSILKDREFWTYELQVAWDEICNGGKTVWFYCCAKGQGKGNLPGYGCKNCHNPDTEPSAYMWPLGGLGGPHPHKPLWNQYIYICPEFWTLKNQDYVIFHEFGRMVGNDGPDFTNDKYDDYVWDQFLEKICAQSNDIQKMQ